MTATRPTPSTPRPYEFPRVWRFTLPNGLRVIVAPVHRLPVVTVLTVVDAGASGDTTGHEGLALLTAAALAEGSEHLDGPALADAFERLGTSVESGGDWDEATVQLTVTPARLDQALGLLAEMLATPRFAEADVERLKTERLAELLQQRVEPRSLADERFARAVYAPSSRYARAAGGTPASVRELDAGQVRTWHTARYVSATTTIILAGDVSPERAHDMVVRHFGEWSGSAPATPAVKADAREQTRRVHVVAESDAPQSELRVGHIGLPRRHPDYFATVIMNAVLGGLFSSRINLNLREAHAYTYGAHSAFDWRRAAGPFVVATAVKTEVTDAAVGEILREIDRIRGEEVSVSELELATNYLAGVFPIRYETTEAVAAALMLATVYDLPEEYFTTYRDRISAVTRADVLAAARAHLHPDALQVLAVGNAPVITEPLAALQLGPLDTSNAEAGEDE
jgi:zinc protease